MALNANALRESFQAVAPHADALAEQFYSQLFTDYPEQRALFAETDFADQHQKLVAALSAVVRQLDDEPALVGIVTRLGERHAEFDLTEDDYAAVAESFLIAFANVLGPEVWTEEYELAWGEALQVIAGIMLEAASKVAASPVSATAAVAEPALAAAASDSHQNSVNSSATAVAEPPIDSTSTFTEHSSRSINDNDLNGGFPSTENKDMITATNQDTATATGTTGLDDSQQQRDFIDYAGQVDAIRKSQAVIEFDMDGTIQYANDNFLNTVGYTLDEIKGQHHRMFVDEAYGRSQEYQSFWAKLNRGEFLADAFKRFGKGGRVIWIQASYNPILDESGQPFKVVKYASDITEQMEMARAHSMVEGMPTNVILANTDLEITYVNPSSIEKLKGLEQFLPVRAEEIVGQNVDIFHKDPSFQRNILSNPKNLPHRAQIHIGSEILDLLVSAVTDSKGAYVGPMVTWDVITEKLRAENEMARVQNMMDNIPINVALANRDFELVYINPASARTLKSLEHLLPKPVDQLLGQSIDIFHKAPEHQRRIVGDPSNLPHKAKIKLGEETLDLLVSAILDKDNNYIGPMITWEIITADERMAAQVSEVVKVVSSSATELQAGSKNMAATSEQTARQSQVVAAASEEATRNVETVSSAAEELTASIGEISRHVQDASKISQQAVQEAASANDTVKELGESSNEIGKVIKVITSIAQQTNLLALNATIEAARAGEAGKGFAVVANEVKELARQTAKATEEISQKIEAIQGSTNIAVNAIGAIGEIIGQINEISTTIAGAVEEQTAATSEISRNVSEAAKGTAEVSENISGVSHAAEDAGKASSDMLVAADGLSTEAERLQQVITEFLNDK